MEDKRLDTTELNADDEDANDEDEEDKEYVEDEEDDEDEEDLKAFIEAFEIAIPMERWLELSAQRDRRLAEKDAGKPDNVTSSS